MFYKKKGFPEEGEVVLCTVKKILPTTVFVMLDEYQEKEGIVHISEIAPGRIRTIRDYVKEGKKLICKVLRLNKERGTLDLSLRRVSKSVQIKRSQELKQEQKAEKVLEVYAQQHKKTLEDIYKLAGFKIVEQFDSLTEGFQEVLEQGDHVLTELGIDKAAAKGLTELIQLRMKPQEVKIERKVSLKSAATNGIEIIKKAVLTAMEKAKKQSYKAEINYIGAPMYKLTIKAPEYKSAEKQMEEIANMMITAVEKSGGEGELIKK